MARILAEIDMIAEQQTDFDRAILQHDLAVAQTGLTIWLGAEPTFTDRRSEAPEWLYQAEGGDKAVRALRVLAAFSRNFTCPMILRTLGRQYPGEDAPRWNFGLYVSRAGARPWRGPPDPALGGAASPAGALGKFLESLSRRFELRGWNNIVLGQGDEKDLRIVYRTDGKPLPAGAEPGSELARTSIHAQAIPEEGLRDSLAERGIFAILAGQAALADSGFSTSGPHHLVPRLELPAFSNVEDFLACLDEVGAAARDAGVDGLVLAGYPPPVDQTISWTTVTPDPAVVEVNMAPAANAEEFHRVIRQLYRSAEEEGLSAFRFHYNGDVTDSGGGGQITFGGPTPESSPFFLKPWLLPNIIRYFNRHPALSYFFTPTCVGSSSQSPRPDERFSESFEELKLALDLLARKDEWPPELIWASLAPFLTDTSGNSHRTEINVEKLWNRNLLGRGCLGLVEFRAFRMASSPETLTARAMLFRAIIAMLASRRDRSELIDWGMELHDRFALPHYLKLDLQEVLDDLEASGLGMGKPVVDRLLDDRDRLLAETEFGGFALTVQRALEFWPLAGDSSSREEGTSRLIDSSTARLQLTLRPQPGCRGSLRDWRVGAGGWRIPARIDHDRHGQFMIFGLRYRAFMPWKGLHPALGAQAPVQLVFQNGLTGAAYRIHLHEWKPQAGPYDGLPSGWEESASRRRERVVVEYLDSIADLQLIEPPSLAVTPYTVDLRACHAVDSF